MRTVIIVAPGYTHQSNGMAALHHLCHSINQSGGDARMMFVYGEQIYFSDPSQNNPEWNTPILRAVDESLIQGSIVIYPEILEGNPLEGSGATRIVRWMGNKDGVLRANKMNAGEKDFICVHSKVLSDKADHVLFYCNINPCFKDDLADRRTLNATYIGKGHLYGQTPIFRDTLLIERLWPSSQEQLAWLLKRVNYFYTWDCWTQTNIEAILCGCIPVFLRYNPFTSEEVDSSELGIIPRLGLYQPQDCHKFRDEKLAMISRIDELRSSWDQRVANFHDHIQEYFR